MSDSGAADTTDGEAGAAVAGVPYPPDGDSHRGRLRSGCAAGVLPPHGRRGRCR